MNRNDKRKTETTARRLSRRAIGIAVPAALLAAAAAMPAQAAGTAAQAPTLPDPAVNLSDAAIPVNVPIVSDSGQIVIGSADEEKKPKTYDLGPLEGQANLLNKPEGEGPCATDVLLRSPIGEEGDLGQVQITSVDPEQSLSGGGSPAAHQYVIQIEIESLPGEKKPVTLETAPFSLVPGEPAHAEEFPPVNQLYTLQEPVRLYAQGGSDTENDEALGELAAFDVIVNQSA